MSRHSVKVDPEQAMEVLQILIRHGVNPALSVACLEELGLVSLQNHCSDSMKVPPGAISWSDAVEVARQERWVFWPNAGVWERLSIPVKYLGRANPGALWARNQRGKRHIITRKAFLYCRK